MRACCVPNCKSGKKVPSHKFPKDPIRCQKWIENLNLHHLENLCANELNKYQVCHKHFHKDDYSCSSHHRFLVTTAVPHIYVNDNDDDIHMVDMDTVSNMQQQPLQSLIKNESEEHTHNKTQQSQSIDVPQLQKVIQHHSEELLEQRQLLEQLNVQQIELQNQVLEIQQNTYEKVIDNNEKEKESVVIQEHEDRLTKLEEQVQRMTTLKKKEDYEEDQFYDISLAQKILLPLQGCFIILVLLYNV